MSNVWERFDSIAKPEDVVEAKSSFKPIDAGVYEMKLESLEPAENRNGLPMLKGRFRVVETNQLLFYNHNLQVAGYQQLTDQNIAEAILLVEGLKGEEIDFQGLASLANEVVGLEKGTLHTIQVTYGKKDVEKSFPQLEVIKEADEDSDDILGWHTEGGDDIEF